MWNIACGACEPIKTIPIPINLYIGGGGGGGVSAGGAMGCVCILIPEKNDKGYYHTRGFIPLELTVVYQLL